MPVDRAGAQSTGTPVEKAAARGRFLDGPAGVLRACAIYWHYVVALWPVLYVSVYLI